MPKVWGGRALERVLGIALPEDGASIGETWELFDRPEGSSRLRGGGTLAELARRSPRELLGDGVATGHEGAFPLMLKFLDAREALSLQVHPDDGQATGDRGKDECCLILAVDDDARFIHGVRPGVSREQLLANLDTAAVEDLLYSFRPEVDQLVHTPPGTPHGMGPGVVAFEIQQNSDVTYRFYDWERGRETHAEQARDVVRVVSNDGPPVVRPTPLPDGGELLLETPYFVVRRYRSAERVCLPTDARYATLTLLRGGGRLGWGAEGEGRSTALAQADTAIVPACVPEFSVDPEGNVDLVVCSPGAR